VPGPLCPRRGPALTRLEGTRAVTHDIIVIGTSAGGLTVLQRLAGALPASLPASVFVIQHIGAMTRLPEILSASGAMPAVLAETGETIRRGRIYVAPPGLHLLLHENHILLRRGPRENMARPAIDPLFRSAAITHGSRVVGVLLSGNLNDGTAGLRAIKRCGGVAIVQDPDEAAYPDMPRNALRHVEVDHVAASSELPGLLVRLAGEPAGKTPEIPLDIRLETAIAAQELADMKTEDRLGERSPFTCPECHGTLWTIEDGDLIRYRCHVGHAFTAEAMETAQSQEYEQLLWSLMRSHNERARLARVMAERERGGNRQGLAGDLLQRAAGYEEDAEILRRLIERRRAPMPQGLAGDDEGQ
jgi:two-component system, chemotaxis family, protein-glutamate methylesterase/glutaminase